MDMIFRIENGGFGYDRSFLFRGVNAEIGDGDILAILGPNGSGKTTMLKCMVNILGLKEGKVLLGERDVREISRREFSKKIAYVPQAKSYSFDCTVLDMVVLGRSPHIPTFSEPSSKDVEIAHDKLDYLGITELKDRSFKTLSGGEMQMVLIARALASEPEILIMDEPESNLDYHNQLKILNTIKEISADVSCIINTHYPEHALRVSNKALLLSRGGTAIGGMTDEIITEERIGNVFGVNTAIGEVEIGGGVLRYVLPISIR
ncbi:MAG: ABC transporter ATP-binding protein [Candidatus Methanoplasma sp.]|nr:ABC transporter ATP-binding protein [Candidatus Methanoplasma sp.]